MVFDNTLSAVEHMRKGTVPVNCKYLVEDDIDISTKEGFTIAKEWHLNEYSSMPLLR